MHAGERRWPVTCASPARPESDASGPPRVRLDLTAASWVSLARLVLVPPMLAALLAGTAWGGWVAAVLLTVAALTDALDGHRARHRREVTTLGKLLDPVADKILVSAAIIGLVQLGAVSSWAAVAVVGREMAVTGLRLVLAGEGVILAAGPWGKRKTVVQCIALPAVMAGLPGAEGLLWLAIALTLWSGLIYFREAFASQS